MGLPPDSNLKEKRKIKNLLKGSLSSLNLAADVNGKNSKVLINQNGGRDLSLEVNHPTYLGKHTGRYVRIYCENVRPGSYFCTIFVNNRSSVKDTIKELVDKHFQRIGETGEFSLFEVYGNILDHAASVDNLNQEKMEELFLTVHKRSLDPDLILMDVLGSATPAPGLSRRLELYPSPVVEPIAQTIISRATTPIIGDYRRKRYPANSVTPSGPYLLKIVGVLPIKDFLYHSLKDLIIVNEDEESWTIGFSDQDNIRLYRDFNALNHNDKNNNSCLDEMEVYAQTSAVIINRPASDTNDIFRFFLKSVEKHGAVRISEELLKLNEERQLYDNDVIEIESFTDKYVFAFKDDQMRSRVNETQENGTSLYSTCSSSTTSQKKDLFNVKILHRASMNRKNIIMSKLTRSKTKTMDIIGVKVDTVNSCSSSQEEEYDDHSSQEKTAITMAVAKMKPMEQEEKYWKKPFPPLHECQILLNKTLLLNTIQSFSTPQLSASLLSTILLASQVSLDEITAILASKGTLIEEDCIEGDYFNTLLESIIKFSIDNLTFCKTKNMTLQEMIWMSVFCYNSSLYLTPGWLTPTISISAYPSPSKFSYNPTQQQSFFYKSRLGPLNEDNKSEMSTITESMHGEIERNISNFKDTLARYADDYLTQSIETALDMVNPFLSFFLFNNYHESHDSFERFDSIQGEENDSKLINLCATLDKIYAAVHANKESNMKKLHSSETSMTNLDKNSGPTDSGVATDIQMPVTKQINHNEFDASDSEESSQLIKDLSIRKLSPSFTSSSSNISNKFKIHTNSTAKVEGIFWKRLFANIHRQIMDTIIKDERVVFDYNQGCKLKYSTSWFKMWIITHRLERHSKIFNNLNDIASLLITPFNDLKESGWNNLRKRFPEVPISILLLILKDFEDPNKTRPFDEDFEIDSLDKTSSEEDPENAVKLRLDTITNKEKLIPSTQNFRKLRDNTSSSICNILASNPIDDPATILETSEARMTVDYLDKTLAEQVPAIKFRWKEFLDNFKPPTILPGARQKILEIINSQSLPGTPKMSKTPVTRSNRIGSIDTSYRSLTRNNNRKVRNHLDSSKNEFDLNDWDSLKSPEIQRPINFGSNRSMNLTGMKNRDFVSDYDKDRLSIGRRSGTMEDITKSPNTSQRNQMFSSTNSLGTKNNVDDYSASDLESVSAITSEDNTNMSRPHRRRIAMNQNQIDQPTKNTLRSKSQFDVNIDSLSLSPGNYELFGSKSNQSINPLSRSTHNLTMPKAFSIKRPINNMEESSFIIGSDFDNRSYNGSFINGRNSALSMSLSCLKNYNIRSENVLSRLNDIQEKTRRNLERIDLIKDAKNSFGLVFIDGSLTKADKIGMFIKSVTKDSPAWRTGKFRFGDEILRVNDKKINEFVFVDALDYIRNCRRATFLVHHDTLDNPDLLLEKKDELL